MVAVLARCIVLILLPAVGPPCALQFMPVQGDSRFGCNFFEPMDVFPQDERKFANIVGSNTTVLPSGRKP